MPQLSPVIVPTKVLKDGRHKVRIRIAHNGRSAYILTDIVIDSASEFRNGQIVRRKDASYLNTRLRQEINKYQQAIDDIEYINGMSVQDVIECIKSGVRDRYMTLQDAFEECMASASCAESTEKNYFYQWNTISRCVNVNTRLANIRASTISSIHSQLLRQRLKQGTINVVMATLKMVINYAIRCGYVEYKVNPLLAYKSKPSGVRESWLTIEQIKQIRDMEIKSRYISRVRDIFMLSYYLGGINVADIKRIDFSKIKKGVLKYERQKTERRYKSNKYVEFAMPEEALVLVDKLAGEDGYIKIGYIVHLMEQLRDLSGIDNLVFYSARKSFAQHAFSLGVSESVIDFILGHALGKGGSCLYSYIQVTPDMATKAIRLVLDKLK